MFIVCIVLLVLIILSIAKDLGILLFKMIVGLIPILLVLAILGAILQKLGCGSKPPDPVVQQEAVQSPAPVEEPPKPLTIPWTKKEIEAYRITEKTVGRKFSDFPPDSDLIKLVKKNNDRLDDLLITIDNWKKYSSITEGSIATFKNTLDEIIRSRPTIVKAIKESPKPSKRQVIRPKK